MYLSLGACNDCLASLTIKSANGASDRCAWANARMCQPWTQVWYDSSPHQQNVGKKKLYGNHLVGRKKVWSHRYPWTLIRRIWNAHKPMSSFSLCTQATRRRPLQKLRTAWTPFKHKHGPEAWLAATPEVTTVEVSESKLQSPELVTVENITHYSGHGSLSELIKCSFCRSRLGVPLVLNNPYQSKRVANSGHRSGTMTL